jgi:hypothetical protein
MGMALGDWAPRETYRHVPLVDVLLEKTVDIEDSVASVDPVRAMTTPEVDTRCAPVILYVGVEELDAQLGDPGNLGA